MLVPSIVKNLILANNDKFFTVEFIKADGSVRKLNGRFFVKGVKAVTSDDRGLLVYDLKAKGYRRVNIDRIKSIKMKHGGVVLS